ncbi:MAG: hypothetical protein J0H87_08195, partial [Holosporales bacterium]|nr:hypothetical protein [Holosporales bacterium]
KKVKESLRKIPRKGVGYGMLKYLTEEGRDRLNNKVEPELSFNYLGQIDGGEENGAIFKASAGEVGVSYSSKNNRKFLIEINARVVKGKLQVSTTYSTKIHHQEGIKKFIDFFRKNLINIIEKSCEETSSSFYVPSDFSLCSLDQSTLDYVTKQISRPIESLYPLSPMQSGFLSTAIRFNGPDPYLRQNLFELKGNIKPSFIKEAWQSVIENEPMLRTGFIWDNISKPLQFILADLKIDWKEHDWEKIPERLHQNKLQDLINLDYETSFDLKNPPLVRFNLIRLASNRYWLLWSIHHIIVDGWCSSILIKKFIMAYEQLSAQQKIILPKTTPYQEYIEWIENQNLEKAEAFWKDALEGAKPTRLSRKIIKETNNRSQYDHFHMELSQEKTELLMKIASKTEMTPSSLIQAAWAILINKYTNQSDITFGVTVSGRAISLPHIDEMIGLFINTLPLRLKILPENDIMDILNQIKEKMLEIQQNGYVSLAKINNWVGLGMNNFLFDNIFIFENYPVEQKAKEGGADMSITCLPSLSNDTPAMNEQTEFPLILGVTPLEKMRFSISYRNDLFSKNEIMQLGNHLANILESFIQNANRE